MFECTANAACDGLGGLSSTLFNFPIIIIQKRAFGKIIGRAKWKFDGTIRLGIFDGCKVDGNNADGVFDSGGQNEENDSRNSKRNDGLGTFESLFEVLHCSLAIIGGRMVLHLFHAAHASADAAADQMANNLSRHNEQSMNEN